MKRILVIGGNGSGKTTISGKLSAKFGLPLVHLDALYWRDNWTTVSRDEFDRLLQIELEKPEWIIDGNFSRTMEHRFRYADTILYFDFSTLKCICGILKRVIKNHGESRPDMGGNCPERFDWQFMKDVFYFNRRNRKTAP